ncbi:MAG: hypothetical protein QOI81_1780, partial [Actinomycetota bacterium]|nr:hypothetical protein [Actinomycetota bacterium]
SGKADPNQLATTEEKVSRVTASA